MKMLEITTTFTRWLFLVVVFLGSIFICPLHGEA